MRGLTVRQPWATRIASLEKRVENRTWATNYSGPLIIHAGTRVDRRFPDARRWPKGALAVARLFTCHPATECDDGAQLRQWSDGNFACYEVGGQPSTDAEPGQVIWHWTLYGVIPFPEPLPCVGRLGLWTPTLDVARAAFALLEATL